MTRLPDWDRRLAEAVAAQLAVAPQWGVADCWTLACAAHEAVRGETLFPALRGYRSEAEGAVLFRRAGFATVQDALAAALPRRSRLKAARGDLAVVVRGDVTACAVVTGDYAVTRAVPGSVERVPLDGLHAVFAVG
jgi:hypothetical protein